MDPADAGVLGGGAMHRLHFGANQDRDAAPRELLGHHGADERLVVRQQRRFGLDHRDLLGAEPLEPRGRLAGDHPAADHGDSPGYLREVGDVVRRPRPGLAQALNRRDGRGASGSHYDGVTGMQHVDGAVGRGDLDGLLAAQPRPAPDHVDPEPSCAHSTWPASSW